ncbi:helix-turn-helix domain-containing protein [Halorussus salinisoli]|uniref:helix-turn-helix domain-containing protein n=1 Tax=Halorussus salinisoli TaxID=2558242 RepID=UPI0010C1840C|nr:helix-turn-helix domain-containing protein [Halorussus salinisoli]
MSVLAELTVPASEFVLADTLTTAPGMRIEIKRVVAGTQHVTPYFWASGGDFETFEQGLRDDPTVQDILTLEEQDDDERFYRVTWESGKASLLSAASDAKATILEAVSDEESWELKVLFPSQDALSEFHDYCVSNDFSFQLDRVYRAENPQERAEYGVTDEQQEALVAAYDAGYFGVPRETTLTELADRLDISRNALSARLRRGQRNLLSNTLVHDE